MLFAFASLAIFQNCGPGFKPSETMTLKSQGLEAHLSHDAGINTEINTPITFYVDGRGTGLAEFEWTHVHGNQSFGCVDAMERTGTSYRVICSTVGQLNVSVTARIGNSSATAASTVNIVNSNSGGGGTPGTVTFRIPAGTANGSWNTRETAIEVYVGQTLEVINDDSVNHQIHTDGAPFPHGNLIAPGATRSHTVASTYSSQQTPLYDHIYQTENPRPNIYIYSFDVTGLNGANLYGNRCASCHGPLATSAKRGKTATQIIEAIRTQQQMMNLRQQLNDNEIAAIALSLRN